MITYKVTCWYLHPWAICSLHNFFGLKEHIGVGNVKYHIICLSIIGRENNSTTNYRTGEEKLSLVLRSLAQANKAKFFIFFFVMSVMINVKGLDQDKWNVLLANNSHKDEF